MRPRKRAILLLVPAFLGVILIAFLFLDFDDLMDTPGPAQVGRIAHPDLIECSGIVASRRYPGVYWTHNDGGSAPALYAISQDGKTIAEFRIAAKNQDWEDIAIDGEGRLYIGQIGNNDLKKDTIKVFRISEPDPSTQGTRKRSRLAVQRTWELKFPGQPFDSESLFIHGAHGYIITKVEKKQPAVLYRFPLETDQRPVFIEKVAELPIHTAVTGADISADGARLAVVSLGSLDVFRINGDPAAAASAPRQQFLLNARHQIEGCCFAPNGILAAAESREIYFFPDPPVP